MTLILAGLLSLFWLGNAAYATFVLSRGFDSITPVHKFLLIAVILVSGVSYAAEFRRFFVLMKEKYYPDEGAFILHTSSKTLVGYRAQVKGDNIHLYSKGARELVIPISDVRHVVVEFGGRRETLTTAKFVEILTRDRR